jgi:UDP-glucose 4-epimerase
MVPNPKSPYAVSKLSAESYVRTIGKLWGIETVSLRVFNAFGPGQNLPPSYPPVVPYFLYQALHNGSIVIHSDGKQTRDYIFLDDVISALVAASTAPNLDGMVVNVGSGKDISVMDLVKLVGSVTGKKIDVIHNPKVAAGVSRMCSDITLAHQKLNFTPSISLEEGLRLTIQRDPKFNE